MENLGRLRNGEKRREKRYRGKLSEHGQRVGRGERGERLKGNTALLGDAAGRMHHERRLASATAQRLGRKERRIGLHKQSVRRNVPRRGAHFVGALERDDSREGDAEAAVEQAAREAGGACVGVYHAAQTVPMPPRHLIEHAQGRVVRLARMHHHGERQLVSKRELLREERALRRKRLGRVVRVEADLADCRHTRAVRRHEAGQRGARLGGERGLVTVEAKGHASRSAQRAAVQLVVASNREDMRNAHLGRACEDGVDVILRAEASRMQKIKEAEGEAEALLAVQTALANSIKLLNEAAPGDNVIKLKALEALTQIADSKSTKLIIPSEIQGLAGLAVLSAGTVIAVVGGCFYA